MAYLLNPECFLQAEDASCHTRSPLCPFAASRHASCHTHSPLCPFAGRRYDTRHVTHVPPCVLLQAEDMTRVMSHMFHLVSFCWQKIRHASCHTRPPLCPFAGRRQDTRHVTHVPPCVHLQADVKTRVMSHTSPLVSYCRQTSRHASCHTRPPCVLLQADVKTRVMSHTFPLVSFCRQKSRHASCHTRPPLCPFPGRRQDTRHVTHVPPSVILQALGVVFVAFTAVWSWTT